MKILKEVKSKKEKKLFILVGTLNFLITNSVLHLSLFLMPIYFSTILSQIVNLIIGYYLYGKMVFKFKKVKNNFRKYFLLSLIIWLINDGFIRSMFSFGLNKNLAAFLIIPFLALISYSCQKKWVFK